ncbi:MAG: type III polyketide synthase [Spirochaetia bacterium]|jgi:predicted naringenin-chalcone synthase
MSSTTLAPVVAPEHTTAVAIHGIATSVPKTSYTQQFAVDFLQKLSVFSDRQRRFLRRLYQNTAIDKRHTVIDDYGKDPSAHTFYPKNDQLLPEPGLEARNDVFIRESNRLSEQAARSLLSSLPLFDPYKITHLITVTCTGFSAPGFDYHLVNALGLRRDIHRSHIGFMGCYAAFPAMRLARDICVANPGAHVLIAAVELCSLHFQQKTDLDFMIANALFADGAAAVLVGPASDAERGQSEGGYFRQGAQLLLNGFASRIIPESEQDMAWKIGAHAFDMRVSAYVPRLIEQNIRSIVEDLLSTTDTAFDDIDIWAVHPGGRAILDRTAAALNIPQSALIHSYEVLREYGNMSSATIFFVLQRILETSESGTVFATAFGPGLTVESGLFRKLP